MSEITSIVSNIVLEKLRQKAIKLRRELNIPHYQALETVSKEAGFNNWHHLIKSAQVTNLSELALYEGLVIAMDVKDAHFSDIEQSFIEDEQIRYLIFDHYVDNYKNTFDESNKRIGDYESEEEIEHTVTLILQNFIFYRFKEAKVPTSIEATKELISKFSSWTPEFVWLKGVLFDAESINAMESKITLEGVKL